MQCFTHSSPRQSTTRPFCRRTDNVCLFLLEGAYFILLDIVCLEDRLSCRGRPEGPGRLEGAYLMGLKGAQSSPRDDKDQFGQVSRRLASSRPPPSGPRLSLGVSSPFRSGLDAGRLSAAVLMDRLSCVRFLPSGTGSGYRQIRRRGGGGEPGETGDPSSLPSHTCQGCVSRIGRL